MTIHKASLVLRDIRIHPRGPDSAPGRPGWAARHARDGRGEALVAAGRPG